MGLQYATVGTSLASAGHRKWHGYPTEVRYAHPDGSNSEDGLTWGTAKQTILAAYDALPSTGGIIYFADQTTIGGEVASQGLWLAGTSDPNYSSLPSGWRQNKPLRLIGVGTYYNGAHGPVAPRIIGGSSSDTAKPGLWTSGGMNGLTIENADFGTLAQPFLLGKSSTGSTDTNNAVAHFRNVHGRVGQTAGYGPVWDLWSCYWVWWEHCTTTSNEQEVYTSDKRAGFLVRGSVIGAGLYWITDHSFNGGGGVKYYGAGGRQMVIERCVQEGVTTGGQIEAPAIWAPDGSGTSAGNVIIRNVEKSDSVGGEPTVRIAAGNDPEQFNIQSVSSVVGPATVNSLYPNAYITAPATNHVKGMMKGRLLGTHLTSRMAFSPTLARFINRAPQDTSTWSGTPGGSTVTTGFTAPDLSTNAARLSSGSFDEKQIARFGQTIAVGDRVVAGVWARAETAGASPTAPMIVGSVNAGNLLDNTAGNTAIASPAFVGTAFEWIVAAGEFTTVGTPSTELLMALRSDNAKSMIYAFPIMYYVPAAACTDDEFWEIVDNLSSHPDSAATGLLAQPYGLSLTGTAGTFHEFKENGTADAAAGAANTFRLFARDNGSGKTQMCVRFNTGAVQVLATEP